jgi:hypothetical protein
LGARADGFVKNDKLRDLARSNAFADASLHFCNEGRLASLRQSLIDRIDDDATPRLRAFELPMMQRVEHNHDRANDRREMRHHRQRAE